MQKQFSWIRVIFLVAITVASDKALRCYDCTWLIAPSGETVVIDGKSWCNKPFEAKLSRHSIDSPTVSEDSNGANRTVSNDNDKVGVNYPRKNQGSTVEVCVTLAGKHRTGDVVGTVTVRAKETIYTAENLTIPTEICKNGTEFKAAFSAKGSRIREYMEHPRAQIQEVCVCNTDGCNNRTAAIAGNNNRTTPIAGNNNRTAAIAGVGIVEMSSSVFVLFPLFLTCSLL